MKRELGIARCGLACCLCSENGQCRGCLADDCTGREWCEVRKCSMEKGLDHCYKCSEAESCQKGILGKLKPKGFTLFAQRYGEEFLLNCLEKNEEKGVIYHRSGITGDYDGCEDIEQLFGRLMENNKK